MNKLLLVALGISVSSAFGETCVHLTKTQGDWAARHLNSAPALANFYVQEGELRRRIFFLYSRAEPRRDREVDNDVRRYRIKDGGEFLDLTKVYVQTGEATWTNVGQMVGCPSSRPATQFFSLRDTSPKPPAQVALRNGK